MQLCPDVIAFPESPAAFPDRWVLMNVHARTCLGIGPEVFRVLGSLPAAHGPVAADGDRFRIWRIARFSHEDGLLADPSRFRRDAGGWAEPALVSRDDLLAQLEGHCIVVSDVDAYRRRFAAKRSVVDGWNFGNYHQQLGQHLLTVLRRDPHEWWVEQKFTPDLSAIRSDTLYGLVQDRFLDEYLPRRFHAGLRVLDLGCGPGVITRKIAGTGARVTGIDPNRDHIDLARRFERPGLEFRQAALGDAGALAEFPDASVDVIFISDALLLYFVPLDRTAPPSLDALVADVRRVLTPSGALVSLEPHPVFYLLPWLGAPDRPFTVVTEYLATRWRITPTLGRLARAFLGAGFAIVHLDEVGAPAGAHAAVEPRAVAFAQEFPLWVLTEFRRLASQDD